MLVNAWTEEVFWLYNIENWERFKSWLTNNKVPLPSQATTLTLSTCTVSGRSLNSTLFKTNVQTLSQKR